MNNFKNRIIEGFFENKEVIFFIITIVIVCLEFNFDMVFNLNIKEFSILMFLKTLFAIIYYLFLITLSYIVFCFIYAKATKKEEI